MKALKHYILSQQYNPSLIGLMINPFYHARRGLYQTIANFAPKLEGRLLDVGCGRKPYRNLFVASEYIGLEVDTPENRANKQADFFYSGTSFPFLDQHFDGVTCNQVLEHVFTPDLFLTEINRVLRPGGQLLLTIPFIWDEHEQPWDYARYTSFGMKSLLEKNGFEILEQQKINADIRVLFQLVNAYLYKVFWTRQPVINLLICVVLMSPFNIFGALLSKVLPGNPDLYLDQIVLARKMAND